MAISKLKYFHLINHATRLAPFISYFPNSERYKYSFLQPVASHFCDINIIAKRIAKAIELHPTDFKKINT